MAKTKQQKQEILQDLINRLKNAKGVVFASYMGLNVVEMEQLRNQLREECVELVVTKKTLLKLALKNNGLEDVDVDSMEGGIALVVGQDEVMPAKIVKKFAKDHEVVKFFGGVMEGKFIDSAQVENLAALPSKDELLTKLVGSLNAPISGFVNVLAGNIRGLVNVLNAIKEQKA